MFANFNVEDSQYLEKEILSHCQLESFEKELFDLGKGLLPKDSKFIPLTNLIREYYWIINGKCLSDKILKFYMFCKCLIVQPKPPIYPLISFFYF